MIRVPGPPRGRRRHIVGDVLRRVESMRLAERSGDHAAVSLLVLVKDVILLVKDLAGDPRVPRAAKLQAGLAVAYLVWPLDVIPDFVPGIGQVDDLVVAVLAVRTLFAAAGYDVIYELWRGSDEGLAVVLNLARIQ